MKLSMCWSATLFLLWCQLLVLPGAGQRQAKAPAPIPQVDLQLSYDSVHAQVVHSGNFSLNGGGVQATFNVGHHWGITGDFMAVTASNVLGSQENLTLYNYHFGGRYWFRNHTGTTPYLQALAGGSTISSNYPLYANNPAYFGSTVGGGLKRRLNGTVGLTLGEVDWVHSGGTNGALDRQNNFRVSAGVVFSFGHAGKPAPCPR